MEQLLKHMPTVVMNLPGSHREVLKTTIGVRLNEDTQVRVVKEHQWVIAFAQVLHFEPTEKRWKSHEPKRVDWVTT